MLSLKEKCVTLRRRGMSLNDLVRRLHKPKTTIYFHIKNIPLSAQRKREIKHASAQRIRAESALRKGKSALQRTFTTFEVWSTKTISLVAHLLFDGQITRHSCIYHNRNTALIKHFKQCMLSIYTFAPKQYFNQKTGVLRIDYNNVALTNFLRAKSQELLTKIVHLAKEEQRIFLQAFFDDEGCAYFNIDRKQRGVRGYQYNPTVLYLVQELLKKFGIESAVLPKQNEVVITRRENIEKFAREVNFTPGVRVNGNRSNSIWKKSLEKRLILRRALQSYL